MSAPGELPVIPARKEKQPEEASFFVAVGGEPTFRRLVGKFYEGVAKDPLLRPLYPEEDLRHAADRRTNPAMPRAARLAPANVDPVRIAQPADRRTALPVKKRCPSQADYPPKLARRVVRRST